MESRTKRFLPATPAMEELTEMPRRLNRGRGLDSTSMVFRRVGDYLTRAGATEVERHTVAQMEWEQHHTTHSCAVAVGRKPG